MLFVYLDRVRTRWQKTREIFRILLHSFIHNASHRLSQHIPDQADLPDPAYPNQARRTDPTIFPGNC